MMMKKTLFVTALFCAALGVVSAQNRLPDLEAYFAATNQLTSPEWDFENRPFRGEEATDTARFGNLTGDLTRIDSYLEFALLTYYSAAEKPWAERGNAILPLNNPRLVDRQLGAMVLKDLAEIKFLDPSNTAAIGRYEGMIKFISDKNGVNRAEMQEYLKQGIAAVVDAEFNKVEFLLQNSPNRSYNVLLTRNTQNQYVLSYEGYFNGTKSTKVLPPASLETLLDMMRKNPSDFNQASINQVRENIALMPGVRLSNKAQENIKDIVASFYANPTGQVNYTTLVAVRILYDNTSVQAFVSGNNDSELFSNVMLAYDSALGILNKDLARKIYDDSNITRSASIPDLPRDQQTTLTQTVSAK
jgi:hypothetical protein